MAPDHDKSVWILLILISTTSSESTEQIRVFTFIKVSTTNAYTSRSNVGQPISTISASVLSCAIHLTQYGPITCMEYNEARGICRSNKEGETVDPLNSRTDVGWSFFNVQSIGNFTEECKLDDLGKEYRGKVNTTVTGIQCMVWSAPGPHTPCLRCKITLINEEGPDILNTNYCRNPDNEPGGPWCYTMDPDVRWENCDVPHCQCYT